jgi:hypothetical protein
MMRPFLPADSSSDAYQYDVVRRRAKTYQVCQFNKCMGGLCSRPLGEVVEIWDDLDHLAVRINGRLFLFVNSVICDQRQCVSESSQCNRYPVVSTHFEYLSKSSPSS